jgi:hypothetical protein
LSTGDTADYQSALRQSAGFPSHYLRQVTNPDQDLTAVNIVGAILFELTLVSRRGAPGAARPTHD